MADFATPKRAIRHTLPKALHDGRTSIPPFIRITYIPSIFLDQCVLITRPHKGIQSLMDLLIGETLFSSSQQRHEPRLELVTGYCTLP